MTIAWVIGSGGLLGTALCKALRRSGTTVFTPTERLNWGRTHVRDAQLTDMVNAFSEKLTATDKWEIYWAAGIGAMSSTAETLVPETEALTVLLQLLAAEPRLMAKQGAIAFASSAGAIYAGSHEPVISEISDIAPTTAYGFEKLKQEEILKAFTITKSNLTTLVTRISTIYGAGQSTEKPQGLLTHIARCILRKKAIQIYVPYDTIRDYIAVEDAAFVIVQSLNLAQSLSNFNIKIVASEKPTTIAEIISIFQRISRRKLLVYTSANKLSSLYSRRVQFKSIILRAPTASSMTSLCIGISNLMLSEQTAYTKAIDHQKYTSLSKAVS